MARRRTRRNPPISMLLLAGAAAVGLWWYFKGRRQSSPVPGVAAGTLAPVDLGNGRTLDPRGIPIGAKLADGSTWAGVTVVDTAAYIDDGRF